MTDNDIPLNNLISVAADGAPNMMGSNKGVLKLLKDNQPEMMTVHCIIHRENLAASTLSPELNESLKKVIKVVNLIQKLNDFSKSFDVKMKNHFFKCFLILICF